MKLNDKSCPQFHKSIAIYYLVSVDLDNDTLVHVGAVAIVVLLGVVGVNSVSHIGTDQVTLGQSLQVSSGGLWKGKN